MVKAETALVRFVLFVAQQAVQQIHTKSNKWSLALNNRE